jgi:hypothetical protein
MIVLGERAEPGGPDHPRPVGPGQPASPIKGAPRLPFSAGKHPSHSSICVIKFSCPEPL